LERFRARHCTALAMTGSARLPLYLDRGSQHLPIVNLSPADVALAKAWLERR
jgi:hypothetical protein